MEYRPTEAQRRGLGWFAHCPRWSVTQGQFTYPLFSLYSRPSATRDLSSVLANGGADELCTRNNHWNESRVVDDSADRECEEWGNRVPNLARGPCTNRLILGRPFSYPHPTRCSAKTLPT